MHKAYFDVSALGRQFDEPSNARVREEAIAVSQILALVDSGEVQIANSAILVREISANHNTLVRDQLLELLDQKAMYVLPEPELFEGLVDRLVLANVSLGDALHTATAIAGEYAFISCDYRLLRKLKRMQVRGWFGTPIEYCRSLGIE